MANGFAIICLPSAGTAELPGKSAERLSYSQDTRLTVRLNHRYPSQQHMLGRFSLSFTADAATMQAAGIRLDLKDSELSDLDFSLGKAYAQQGQAEKAVAAFGRALALAGDPAAKGKIITAAAPLGGVSEKLAERFAGNAQFQTELAQHFAARADWNRAAAAYSRAVGLQPLNNGAMGFAYAAVLLLSGDQPGYRKICAEMLQLSGKKP